ncbi:hypothetical protein OHB12_25330 [Nocardia sp. NBC_01730]|uniref:hypothetical protein n=1 Tax=Nocardia sp. NBC_01730 TaxID=2975998 RepID=UPI002E0F4D8B|nr:hypothetical protein OHB12_25330 [Nocardia sp. NBC_01730]
MSLSKTATLRRLTRVAAAGALVVVPLAGLAATASAEAPNPAPDVVQVQLVDAPQQGADIDGRIHHHRHDRRGPDDHDWQGNQPWQGGPPAPQQFQQFLPSTGSS